MKKDNAFDFGSNWYDVWMKQSKEFYKSADQNLNDLFQKNKVVQPEEHLDQIEDWMTKLKQQWQVIELAEQHKAYENYWKAMIKMSSEACDLMLKKWISRAKEKDPIQNVRQVYELWLNSCNEIYANAMHTHTYQEVYGDYINATLNYWKSVIPK